MALNLANAAAALKEDYQPAMREQLNNSIMLLQQIERNTEDVEGLEAVLSLHVRRNHGIGARADGGTLPTAKNQKYTKERVGLRYNYGRIEITGPTIKAMRSNAGSFVRAVDSETRGVTTDLRRDVNRQLFGTSNGVIIKVAANSSTTTLNLHADATTTQKNQLEVGMIIDIGTSSPFTSVATEREITAINFDVNDVPESIVISGANVTTSNGDSVVRSGSGGSGSSQVELTGLQTIVSNSGTLFSVDPTVEPVWKSTVLSNGGTLRAATETLLAQAVQKGAIRGGVEIDVFVTSDGVHRNYASQLNTYKRINDTLELKGGYKALSLAAGSSEKGVIWDRDCPNNQAFGLAFAHLTQHEASDWEWMDDDGAVLSRVSGKDAYEATLYKYHELTTDKRNAHVLVKDLSES